MGEIREGSQRAKLFFGVLAPSESACEGLEKRLALEFSPIEARSRFIAFDQTHYYEKEMGPDLVRRWVSVANPISVTELVAIKRFTNTLEQLFARDGRRTINIDPGYVTLGKVVLATTKDYDHRLYIGSGIYEEVTLRYRRTSAGFEPWPWTYPDYSTPEALEFFKHVRDLLAMDRMQ